MKYFTYLASSVWGAIVNASLCLSLLIYVVIGLILNGILNGKVTVPLLVGTFAIAKFHLKLLNAEEMVDYINFLQEQVMEQF